MINCDNLMNVLFFLTVSKWKVVKKVPVQIICNCPQTQKAGTDLYYFYDKCRLKRKSMLPAKNIEHGFLKLDLYQNNLQRKQMIIWTTILQQGILTKY